MSGIIVSAPGKAFLFGEYAVLDGCPAVVCALDVRAYAYASRELLGEARPSETSFVAEAMQVLRDYSEAHPPPNPVQDAVELPLVTTHGFTAGGRKLGMGSSAAVAASVVGYGLTRAGHDLSSPEVQQLAHKLAAKAHAQAQDGKGSGADVAAAALGGVQIGSRGDYRSLELPTWMHLGFFDVGAPAKTTSMVAAVAAGREKAPDEHASAVAAIRQGCESFQSICRGADANMPALVEAASDHVVGLRGLQALSGANIVTPRMDQLLALAQRLGLAAKPSGAGGGDLVVVFADSSARLDRFSVALWREHRISRIDQAVLSPLGLRVESRPPTTSRLRDFFKLNIADRRRRLSVASGVALSQFEQADIGALDLETADHMIENVVGTLALPVGIATNFKINGKDYLVPMCVEEASVVAAASNAARMVRTSGGFVTHSDPPWMITQIQLIGSGDHKPVVERINAARDELLALADLSHPRLVERGGGARELEVRILDAHNLAVHVFVDCRDAMGANLLNTVAERLAPRLEELSGRRSRLRILSNLADCRTTHVHARISPEVLGNDRYRGEAVVEAIVEASRFAELDPYRATTHNKGIMNGVDALVLATGNDWRAVEASAHAFAARSGTYRPLAIWRRGRDGYLEGQMAIPTAVGVVGGATRTHPMARLSLELLGFPSAPELGRVMASAGLASNLAALKALATEGIQRGHMALHARSVAVGAGAQGWEIEEIAAELVRVSEIKTEQAKLLLSQLRATSSSRRPLSN